MTVAKDRVMVLVIFVLVPTSVTLVKVTVMVVQAVCLILNVEPTTAPLLCLPLMTVAKALGKAVSTQEDATMERATVMVIVNVVGI